MSSTEITFPKRIALWGSSLAVVIPSDVVKELDLKIEEMVDVTVKKRV